MSRRDGAQAPRSISARVFTMACVAVAVVYVLLLGVFYLQSAWQADRTYDRVLKSAALAMLERVYTLPAGPSVDVPAAAFDTLALARDDRIFYRIYTADGRDLTGDRDLPHATGPVSAQPRIWTEHWSGEAVRFLTQSRRLLTEHGQIWVSVQLGQTRRTRDAEMMRAFGWNALGLSVVALMLCGLVPLGARAAVAPLAGLGRDLGARAPDHLAPLRTTPPQEVSHLVAALNGFMARVGDLQVRNERFIADVAHQFRTGVNATDAHVQMAQAARSPSVASAHLAHARAQSAATMRLTNQLLAHAMVTHRSSAQSPGPLDLDALLRETLSQTLRDTRFAAVTLEYEGPDDGQAWIAGDPVSLREAVRNILENALQHGMPPEGAMENRPALALRIAVLCGAGHITLEMADNGIGIAARDRARVLERFATQGARAGTGLGLAIVAEVARAHGADLALDQSAGGGLTVRLRFARMAAGGFTGGDPGHNAPHGLGGANATPTDVTPRGEGGARNRTLARRDGRIGHEGGASDRACKGRQG
ncbi:sensor histidine kinase [Rhodobacteraceae bacterium]|nr:sensor histidine kinase [Paracoccaceae bacterium]